MPATWKTVRRRRQPGRPEGPVQPGRRDLRRRALPEAAGGDQDIRKAIFAYNHADWYVDSVLLRARVIGGLPEQPRRLAHRPHPGPLPGRGQGDLRRRPLRARHQDDEGQGQQGRRRRVRRRSAAASRSSPTQGAPVVAVNDGRVPRIGTSKRLGRFVQLQDVYGNTYTYGHLAKVSKRYPAPKPQKVDQARDPAGAQAAGEGRHADARPRRTPKAPAARAPKTATAARPPRPSRSRRRATPRAAVDRQGRQAAPVRQPAPPERGRSRRRPAGVPAHGPHRRRLDLPGLPHARLGLARDRLVIKKLKVGSQVLAGHGPRPHRQRTRSAPHVRFEIRPAGRGAPRIDPKPILDGWKLLESTAIYRAAGKNPFVGPDADDPVDRPDPADEQGDAAAARRSPTRASRSTTAAATTSRPARSTAACWRRSSSSSPRASSPTVTSLKCGHSLPDGLGQRLRALDRHARSTSPRSTASRSSATRARARSPS